MSKLKLSKKTAGKEKAYIRAPHQERETAKRLGGKRVQGSGSGWEKGDVRIKSLARLECKCTKHKSFTVTLAMVEKIEAAGLGAGEVGVIEIEFLLDRGRKKKVCVLPDYALLELIEGNKKAHGTT